MNSIQTTLHGTQVPVINSLKRKDDEIVYFPSDEIIEDIVDEWESYETLNDFVKTIIDVPSAKYQFNRLCQGYNNVGYNISLLFNPHRLATPTWKEKGLFYGFQDDVKYHRQFAKYLVKTAQKVPVAVQYSSRISYGHKGYQYVQEFPPYLARDIYLTYCSDGDKILNQCAGWGGRIIGLASCLFKNIEYWETEPSTQTYNGLLKLKEFLRLDIDKYMTFNEPFERLGVPENYFDFAFTSPPYYDTERYSKEQTQSYMWNKSYEEWRDNWLYRFLDRTIYSLKKNGVCLLNIGRNRFNMDTDIQQYLYDNYNIDAYFVDEFKERLDKNNDGLNKEEKRYERHNGGEQFLEFRITTKKKKRKEYLK